MRKKSTTSSLGGTGTGAAPLTFQSLQGMFPVRSTTSTQSIGNNNNGTAQRPNFSAVGQDDGPTSPAEAPSSSGNNANLLYTGPTSLFTLNIGAGKDTATPAPRGKQQQQQQHTALCPSDMGPLKPTGGFIRAGLPSGTHIKRRPRSVPRQIPEGRVVHGSGGGGGGGYNSNAASNQKGGNYGTPLMQGLTRTQQQQQQQPGEFTPSSSPTTVQLGEKSPFYGKETVAAGAFHVSLTTMASTEELVGARAETKPIKYTRRADPSPAPSRPRRANRQKQHRGMTSAASPPQSSFQLLHPQYLQDVQRDMHRQASDTVMLDTPPRERSSNRRHVVLNASSSGALLPQARRVLSSIDTTSSSFKGVAKEEALRSYLALCEELQVEPNHHWVSTLITAATAGDSADSNMELNNTVNVASPLLLTSEEGTAAAAGASTATSSSTAVIKRPKSCAKSPGTGHASTGGKSPRTGRAGAGTAKAPTLTPLSSSPQGTLAATRTKAQQQQRSTADVCLDKMSAFCTQYLHPFRSMMEVLRQRRDDVQSSLDKFAAVCSELDTLPTKHLPQDHSGTTAAAPAAGVATGTITRKASTTSSTGSTGHIVRGAGAAATTAAYPSPLNSSSRQAATVTNLQGKAEELTESLRGIQQSVTRLLLKMGECAKAAHKPLGTFSGSSSSNVVSGGGATGTATPRGAATASSMEEGTPKQTPSGGSRQSGGYEAFVSPLPRVPPSGGSGGGIGLLNSPLATDAGSSAGARAHVPRGFVNFVSSQEKEIVVQLTGLCETVQALMQQRDGFLHVEDAAILSTPLFLSVEAPMTALSSARTEKMDDSVSNATEKISVASRRKSQVTTPRQSAGGRTPRQTGKNSTTLTPRTKGLKQKSSTAASSNEGSQRAVTAATAVVKRKSIQPHFVLAGFNLAATTTTTAPAAAAAASGVVAAGSQIVEALPSSSLPSHRDDATGQQQQQQGSTVSVIVLSSGATAESTTARSKRLSVDSQGSSSALNNTVCSSKGIKKSSQQKSASSSVGLAASLASPGAAAARGSTTNEPSRSQSAGPGKKLKRSSSTGVNARGAASGGSGGAASLQSPGVATSVTLRSSVPSRDTLVSTLGHSALPCQSAAELITARQVEEALGVWNAISAILTGDSGEQYAGSQSGALVSSSTSAAAAGTVYTGAGRPPIARGPNAAIPPMSVTSGDGGPLDNSPRPSSSSSFGAPVSKLAALAGQVTSTSTNDDNSSGHGFIAVSAQQSSPPLPYGLTVVPGTFTDELHRAYASEKGNNGITEEKGVAAAPEMVETILSQGGTPDQLSVGDTQKPVKQQSGSGRVTDDDSVIRKACGAATEARLALNLTRATSRSHSSGTGDKDDDDADSGDKEHEHDEQQDAESFRNEVRAAEGLSHRTPSSDPLTQSEAALTAASCIFPPTSASAATMEPSGTVVSPSHFHVKEAAAVMARHWRQCRRAKMSALLLRTARMDEQERVAELQQRSVLEARVRRALLSWVQRRRTRKAVALEAEGKRKLEAAAAALARVGSTQAEKEKRLIASGRAGGSNNTSESDGASPLHSHRALTAREKFQLRKEQRKAMMNQSANTSSTTQTAATAPDVSFDGSLDAFAVGKEATKAEGVSRQQHQHAPAPPAVSPLPLLANGISTKAIGSYNRDSDSFEVALLHRLLRAPQALLYTVRVVTDRYPTRPPMGYAKSKPSSGTREVPQSISPERPAPAEPAGSTAQGRTESTLSPAALKAREALAKKGIYTVPFSAARPLLSYSATLSFSTAAGVTEGSSGVVGEESPKRAKRTAKSPRTSMPAKTQKSSAAVSPTGGAGVHSGRLHHAFSLPIPLSIRYDSYVDVYELRHEMPVVKDFARPFERWGIANALSRRIFTAAAIYAWQLIFSHTPHDDYKQCQLRTPEEKTSRLDRVEQRNRMILACYCVHSEREWLREASKDLSFVGQIWNPKKSMDANDPDFDRHCRETYDFVEEFLYQCFPTANSLDDVPSFLVGAGVYFLLKSVFHEYALTDTMADAAKAWAALPEVQQTVPTLETSRLSGYKQEVIQRCELMNLLERMGYWLSGHNPWAGVDDSTSVLNRASPQASLGFEPAIISSAFGEEPFVTSSGGAGGLHRPLATQMSMSPTLASISPTYDTVSLQGTLNGTSFKAASGGIGGGGPGSPWQGNNNSNSEALSGSGGAPSNATTPSAFAATRQGQHNVMYAATTSATATTSAGAAGSLRGATPLEQEAAAYEHAQERQRPHARLARVPAAALTKSNYKSEKYLQKRERSLVLALVRWAKDQAKQSGASSPVSRVSGFDGDELLLLFPKKFLVQLAETLTLELMGLRLDLEVCEDLDCVE